MRQVEKQYVRALWVTSLALILYLFASQKLSTFQDRSPVAGLRLHTDEPARR